MKKVFALAMVFGLFVACGGSGGTGNAEGYVFIYENQGAWGDAGGVRAYFAEKLHRRKTPGFLETRLLSEVARQGACALYQPPLTRGLRMELCDPPCGEDRFCTGTSCAAYPPHWNAGPLQIDGLHAPLQVEPDAYDNYQADALPADLFPSSGDITVAGPGGELGSFAMTGGAVAPLGVGAIGYKLAPSQPLAVTWTPADPGSRVQLFLRAGIHAPALPVAIICEADDGAGRFDIDSSLVDGFLESAFILQHISEIMRYRSAQGTPFGKTVELRIASVVELGLELP